jgi:RimJ/RimL family protein N-acetyltransferase
VRAVSFSSEPIPWEQHLKWFGTKLRDPNCVFYIAVNEDETPIGQVRYDVSDGQAVISISLDARFRGKRYGPTMIALASQELYQTSQVRLIHSYVKTGNEASVEAFLKAGFRQTDMTLMHGQPAVHLILPKEE